jgi:hypothetical protein
VATVLLVRAGKMICVIVLDLEVGVIGLAGTVVAGVAALLRVLWWR